MRIFYRITPVSVLFFRDPKPFMAGEQSLGRLLFPPRLTPFLGALRTKLLEDRAKAEGKKIPEIFNNYEQQLRSISIIWFSIIKDNKPLLPLPFDTFTKWQLLTDDRFVFEKASDKEQMLKVPISNLKAYKTSSNPASYITIEGFCEYQNGSIPFADELFKTTELWEFENRVGITLNPELKTTERSKFYRLTVARLKQGVSFLVGVEHDDRIDLPETFTTCLGGEGHIAVWEKEDKVSGQLTEKLPHFKEIVALTHIPIKNTENPGFEIQNWCINKLDIISGWDYREHRPKPLVKALKPGTVITVKRSGNVTPCKAYEIDFDGVKLTVIKNLTLSMKEEKIYLTGFTPDLGEPDSLFIVKN